MIQEIQGNDGQVTQAGHIINCHGGATCPYRDTPESQRQAEFARSTGVWCEPRARKQLERLMSDHGFTARELAAAWRQSSIVWNADDARIAVRTYLFEAVFAWGLITMMLVYYLLTAVPVLFSDTRNWQSAFAFLMATALYLGAAWLAGRFVLWPRRVALRVRRALAEQ